MIPYGTETPIVSLVTHDKLRFFIDDIGHPEWGVDMLHDDFARRLIDTSLVALGSRTQQQSAIRESAERLWDVSRKNVAEFLAAVEA
jgi:hypothetical protein